MRESVTAGALAGLTGTVPMTMTMAALRHFPHYDPTPLPPQRVAKSIRKKLDIENKMDAPERSAFTWIMHFGIGAAGGAGYALLTSQPHDKPLLKGIGFGLGVWASSYLSGLPALGITRGAMHEPQQHVAAQILSHVVWGGALGLLLHRMKSISAAKF